MLNLLNRRFGRVIVVGKTNDRQGNSIIWSCNCDCGALNIPISARDLIAGRKGCGRCADTSHPLYPTWVSMKDRCSNPNTPNYKHYGGRGIVVCDEWKNNFLKFLEDMGPKPYSTWSLDRKDVNGNYCKENCRWADDDTQANNRRPTQRGLTEEQILDIYTSKISEDEQVLKHGVSAKTVKNIKCLQYSQKATKICFDYVKQKSSNAH